MSADFVLGMLMGLGLACVVLLPQRRGRGGRAELASEDVATTWRRAGHGSAQDAGRTGGTT